MSFIERAQKLRARGEDARALLVLVEGLKRHPDSAAGIDMLLRWYALEIPTPGIEPDVVSCLLLQPDGDDLLSTIVDNLRASGVEDIADALLEAGEQRGLRYVPPAPEAIQSRDDLERAASPAISGSADATFEATIATAQMPEDDEIDVAPVSIPAPTTAAAIPSPTTAARTKAPGVTATPSQTAPKSPSKRKRWVVGIVVLILVAVVVFFSREKARQIAAISSLDTHIMSLDPIHLEDALKMANEAAATWPDDAEILERKAFLEAVNSKGEGELSENPTTAFGLAANALKSLQRGELETAIATATRLEHTYPEQVIALWVQGMVLEKRGKLSAAARVYTAVAQQNSEFLAGWLGQIRVQTRLGFQQDIGPACDRLAALVAKHPYLVACTAQFPIQDDYFGNTKGSAGPSTVGVDEFTTAVGSLQTALSLLRQHKRLEALAAAENAAKDAQLAQAQILVAVLRIANYDIERGEAALQNVSHLDGLNEAQLVLAQSVGPMALAYAGRPDVARRYIAMFGTDVEGVDGEQQGVFATRWNDWKPEFTMALIARLVVMNELGTVQEAARLAQQHMGFPGAQAIGFVLSIIAEQGGANVQVPPLDSDTADAGAVAKAAIEGRSRKVIDLAARVPAESSYRSTVIRFLTQAHLALRETGDALRALDQTQHPLVDAIFLDGMRLRVLSRFGKENPAYVAELERVLRAQAVGVNRLVDIAYANFWQGRIKDSEAAIQKALALNPSHRQGNWLYGLLLRQKGSFREAQQYFERSGRDYDNSVDVLIELGISLGDLGNHDEARKMFYKAILLDRTNLDALSGLGAAYVKLGGETSARDLERIVSGYPASREFGAQKAEALKWLAVVKGLRSGKTAALADLDAAETLVGKRPDLLVERARFAEASADYAGARSLYAQALQRNSAMGDAHLGLAKMAIREGDQKVARDHLEKYLELEPRGDSRAWAEQKLASF